ncbi:hypothetical protein ACE3MQ_23090 [Paenibacillus lentus]|uniref:hypothetical protein n=1 Tax=Paenibacillus lentus TaxID=1338368 RepID=UPI0036463220
MMQAKQDSRPECKPSLRLSCFALPGIVVRFPASDLALTAAAIARYGDVQRAVQNATALGAVRFTANPSEGAAGAL